MTKHPHKHWGCSVVSGDNALTHSVIDTLTNIARRWCWVVSESSETGSSKAQGSSCCLWWRCWAEVIWWTMWGVSGEALLRHKDCPVVSCDIVTSPRRSNRVTDRLPQAKGVKLLRYNNDLLWRDILWMSHNNLLTLDPELIFFLFKLWSDSEIWLVKVEYNLTN